MKPQADFDWSESLPTPEEIAADLQRIESHHARVQKRSELAWNIIASGRTWLVVAAMMPLGALLTFTALPRLYIGLDPAVLWIVSLVGTGNGIWMLMKLHAHVRDNPKSEIATRVSEPQGEFVSLGQLVQWAAYSAVGISSLVYLGWMSLAAAR